MGARSSAGILAAGFIACGVALSTPSTLLGADAVPAGDKTEAAPTDKSQGFREEQDTIQQAIDQLRREVNAQVKTASEQTTRDAAMLAERGSDALDSRLNVIERTLSSQHEREVEALQSSNRTLLIIAGVFAGIGLLGILFAALIMVRAMNRLAEIAMTVPMGHPPGGGGRSLIALGVGDLQPAAAVGPGDQVNTRFLGAIERLEKRIGELEHTAQAPAPAAGELNHTANQPKTAAPEKLPAESAEGSELSIKALRSKKSNGYPVAAAAASPDTSSQVALLLGKGQALLNLGQAEEALSTFEMAIALDATSADALVKRGMALEKLQKMEEALDSYDRAIAANGSMTLAYLFKGAVCNRLQRFREALDCYEKALKTEQKPVAS